MSDEPTKKLQLTIEVDNIWADDLDESAEIMKDACDDYTDADARLDVVLNEWFNERCFVVLTTIPGDKCMNDEFDHIGREARIVGAEAVPVRRGRLSGGVSDDE